MTVWAFVRPQKAITFKTLLGCVGDGKTVSLTSTNCSVSIASVSSRASNQFRPHICARDKIGEFCYRLCDNLQAFTFK